MCTKTMLWSAVLVCVLGSVLTLPTTTQVPTDPPAVTTSTVSSVPLPPGELELILDTLLTQVDRHNTWLETLQDDVYSLGDSVEMHSLDLQELRKEVRKIHKDDNKSSKHSHEDSLDSEESLLDSLSLDTSWNKGGSSQDSSNDLYDEENLELFRDREKEFIGKYHGNSRGTNKRRGRPTPGEGDRSDTEEDIEEEEETEETEDHRRHGNNGSQHNRGQHNRGRTNSRREDENTDESREGSQENHESDESHDHHESYEHSDESNSK